MGKTSNITQEIFPPTKELGQVENTVGVTLIIKSDFSESLLKSVSQVDGKEGCVDISYVRAFADGSVQIAYDLYDDTDNHPQLFPSGSEDAIYLQNEIKDEAARRGMQWFITIGAENNPATQPAP